MRLEDRPRTVWIDAVCIDQTSVSDRSQQVSLMTIIHWKASGNLVYLGKDDGSAEAALRAIGYIVKDMEAATDGLRSLMETLHDRRTGTSSFC